MMNAIKEVDWAAWIGVIVLIVGFRESALWITGQFNHPEMGNLLGLISLLIVLLVFRKLGALSKRVVDTTNVLMKESAFAFLPVSAGSLLMIMQLGPKIPAIVFILFVSTLIPLWVYAKMAKRWL